MGHYDEQRGKSMSKEIEFAHDIPNLTSEEIIKLGYSLKGDALARFSDMCTNEIKADHNQEIEEIKADHDQKTEEIDEVLEYVTNLLKDLKCKL